jgi:hypothetical protein
MQILESIKEAQQLAHQYHNNATKMDKFNLDKHNAINAKHAQLEILLLTINAQFLDQLAHASKNTTKQLTNV